VNDYNWIYFGRGFDSRRLHHLKEIMIKFIMMFVGIGYAGTVDRIESNFAHVIFTFENSTSIAADIPIALLPCEVNEGDTLHVQKTNGITEIRCNKPAPTTANVDVDINPVTGEIHYIIKDIQIELEQ